MTNLEKFYWFTWIPKLFFIMFYIFTLNPGWLVGWGITTLAGLITIVLLYINTKKEISIND